MPKRILCFSFWGTDPVYLEGALQNARLAPSVYPGWTCRFYVGSRVPKGVRDELRTLGCEIVEFSEDAAIDGYFQRFLAAEEGADAVVFRDSDSRLNAHEAAAVKEWIESGKAFHIMRDHPFHNVEMLAGMWGVRGNALADIRRLVGAGKWLTDQEFLAEVVYPRARENVLVHDAFGGEKGARRFPTGLWRIRFVGEQMDRLGKPRFFLHYHRLWRLFLFHVLRHRYPGGTFFRRASNKPID